MLVNAVKVQKPNEKTNHNEQNLRTKQQHPMLQTSGACKLSSQRER